MVKKGGKFKCNSDMQFSFRYTRVKDGWEWVLASFRETGGKLLATEGPIELTFLNGCTIVL